MTYNDIIQQVGKRVEKHVYYENNDVTTFVSDDNIERITLKLNSNLIGTAIRSCELELKEQISGTVYVQVEATYQEETQFKTYGPYLVIEEEYDANKKTYRYTAYDNLVKTMIDYEPVSISYPTTVYNYFSALCNKLGYTNNIQSLPNGARPISIDLYDNIGYTYRDVLDDIAEANGVLFYIDTNEIKIAQFNANAISIDDDILKNQNIEFGKHYGPINSITLSRSADSDIIHIKDDESIEEYGLCEFNINDNQIMNFNDRSDYLQALSEQLFGIEYDIYDTELVGYGDVAIFDEVSFETGENTYSSYIFNNEIVLTSGYKQTIYNEEPEEHVTNYKYSSQTDRGLKQAYIIVDKQGQRIDSVVSTVTSQGSQITELNQTVSGITTTVTQQIGEQNQKISSVEQTVDEINQKIQDIADITTSGESSYGRVDLLNVNESEPIAIRIRPLGTDITCIYPSNTLYPSDTLYPQGRTLRFTNTTTGDVFTYELPGDLLYYDDDNYDEFSLAYGDGTTSSCIITKRVEHTTVNGVNQRLSQEVVVTYPYPTINLTSGDYTIELLSYGNAYLYVQLMASNIYTTQFATRVELSSSINQTKDEINLEVSKKVDNDQVIASINLTSEQATIDASKINIRGTLQAINNDTTTTINGNKITTGSITADKVSSDIITTNNISAQTINANKISGGTISASNINLGSSNFAVNTNGVLTSKAGSIAGWTINGTYLSYGGDGGQNGARLYRDGRIYLKSDYGWLNMGSGGAYFNGNSNVIISDRPGTQSQSNPNATISVRAFDGHLRLNSNYAVYANNTLLASGSSKNMKENIKELDNDDKKEIYDIIKELPMYKYDYKEQYSGQKDNYGIIIEDFENSKLGDVLHVVKSTDDSNVKNYSHDDLTLVNLLIVKELMNKIDKLEKEVEKLKEEKCKK